MTPACKVIPQYRPETKTTRSSRAAEILDQPDADPLGFRRVFTQVAHDLYGTKDVQDAVTASYVWMADQIGHLALGLLPTLLFGWIWQLLCRSLGIGRGLVHRRLRGDRARDFCLLDLQGAAGL